ncbi:MAG: MFS transporter [Aeriscardovia sp.]|nr:MFS transporter [Aeriscardovia sp.]
MAEKAEQNEHASGAKPKSKWLSLIGLVVAISAVIMDGTIMNVALPSIMQVFNLNASNGEWIVSIYSLIFCALLVTSGRIADAVGRKKMLIWGLVVFALGSVLGALAGKFGGYAMLMGARVIQGVGGAMILPTIFSTRNAIYPGGMRIVAVALVGSRRSARFGVGPWLGGLLVTYANWQWVFWIEIPLAAVSAVFVVFTIPDTYGEKFRGLDVLGLILSVVGFGGIVYGLIEGKSMGWWRPSKGSSSWAGLSPVPWTLFIGAVALVLFLLWQARRVGKGKSYIMDLRVFRIHTFSLSVAVQIVFRTGLIGILFILPQFLQNVLGMSALQAGEITCCTGFASLISGLLAAPLVKLTSTKTVIVWGMAIQALSLVGLFFLFRISPSPGAWALRGWLIAYGFGLGLTSAQLSAILMSGVPNKWGGQASSIQSTAVQLASSLGVGIIASVFTAFLWAEIPAAVNSTSLSAQEREGVTTSVISTQGASIPEIEKGLSKRPDGAAVDAHIKRGFENGIADTTLVSAGVLAASFVMCLWFPGKKKLKEEREEVREEDREESKEGVTERA